MEKYEQPKIEIIEFELTADIVTTSCPTDTEHQCYIYNN